MSTVNLTTLYKNTYNYISLLRSNPVICIYLSTPSKLFNVGKKGKFDMMTIFTAATNYQLHYQLVCQIFD